MNKYHAFKFTFIIIAIAALISNSVQATSAQAELVKTVVVPQITRFAPTAQPGWSVTLPAFTQVNNLKVQSAKINQPLRVGIGRDLPAAQATELTPAALGWTATDNGGQLAVLQIASDGARAIRAALQIYAMPETAELRIFAVDKSDSPVFAVTGSEINARLAVDQAARDGDEDAPLLYWLPIVAGRTTGVEIYLPPGVVATGVRVAVPKLAHLFVAPNSLMPIEKGVSDSGNCTVDIMCHMNRWGDIANATARAYLTNGLGDTYACSGSLIVDKDPSSQVPYFITARHCIANQGEASTLQTYWFFRNETCNGAFTGSALKILSGGSTMLFTSQSTDITLVRLNGMPPNGTTMVGWNAAKAPRKVAVGNVSHPQADLQKIAFGTMHGYINCYLNNPNDLECGHNETDIGNFMVASFNSGMPQQGSSGSGLFLDNSHTLIGIFSNGHWNDIDNDGMVECGEPVYQYNFGRFDLAFQEGIKNWLNVTNACNLEPGDWNYCSNLACGLCAEGMGDCDADAECRTGLVCSQNMGAQYGFVSTLDVCTKTGSPQPEGDCTRQPGDWDYCTDPQCGPCASGQGDCDSNSECQGGLVCLPNTGAQYGFPAAVSTCGPAPTTTCGRAPGDWGYCSDPNCRLCTEGLGDCDSDSECGPGLECRSNIGANYGFAATMDVCVLPTTRICTRQVGDWGYCSDVACGPCQTGEGDCDQNSECDNGLFCALNAGERHDLPPNMDVCEPHQF